jgi:hypothetical protein
MSGRGRRLLWCTGAAAALVSAGCAKSPAGAGRGTRLIVTMQFQDPVYSLYNYFFIIRNFSDPVGQNSPIPPIEGPYGGNGFATGRTGNEPPFTDFVAFGGGGRWSGSPTGYTLWHLPTKSDTGLYDPTNFIVRGQPVSATPPNGGNLLQFELDLSQIAPATGDPVPPTDERPRYIQVNIIATTTTPIIAQGAAPDYIVDAMGNQSFPASGSFNAFLQIDTSKSGTYTSRDAVSELEERERDTFNVNGTYDPRVDLVFWSIRVEGG